MQKRFFVTLFMVAFIFLAPSLGLGEEAREPSKPGEVGTAPPKVEEPVVTGTASVGVFNKYIFRGYEIGRRSAVVQPSLTTSYKGFSATFWGNVDTNSHDSQTVSPSSRGQNRKREWNETDLTLSYTHTVGKLSLTGGWIYYALKYADETEEFYVSGSYDTLFKPTLSVYQDYRSYPGTYINFGLAHAIKVYKEVTLDLAASFAYMSGQGRFWQTYNRTTADYTGSMYRALHDGMVKAGLTIPVTKKIALQPTAQYWYPLSGEAKRKIGPNSYNPSGYLATNFVGGMTLLFSF